MFRQRDERDEIVENESNDRFITDYLNDRYKKEDDEEEDTPITIDFEQFIAITRDLTGLKLGEVSRVHTEYFDNTPHEDMEDLTSYVEEGESPIVDDFNVDAGEDDDE